MQTLCRWQGFLVDKVYVSMVGYVVWVKYVSMFVCVAVDRNTALILLKQGCQVQQMKQGIPLYVDFRQYAWTISLCKFIP